MASKPNGRRGGRRGRPSPQCDNTTPVLNALDDIHCKDGQIHGVEKAGEAYVTERTNFCHMIHKRKVRVNHLDGLLEIREREFGEEYKKSYETIRRQEAEIAQLRKSLQAQEEKTKQDSEILQLRERPQTQLDTDTSSEIVKEKETEISELKKRLQAQEEKEKKSYETMTKQESEIYQLRKRLQAQEEKGKKSYETMTKQESEIYQLRKRLQAQVVTDKSSETIKEKETEISHLRKLLQTRLKTSEAEQRLSKQRFDEMVARYEAELKKVSHQGTLMEEQILQKDTEILQLKKHNEDLTHELTDTTSQLASKEAELLQSNRAWQTKCDALEDTSRNELAVKELFWETKVQQMEDEKTMMEDKIAEQKQQGQVVDAMLQSELAKNQALETKLREVEDDLASKTQGWEKQVQELQTDNKTLERLCLSLKKKVRGLFSSKKIQDPQTELQRMKEKMLKKEQAKREKEEKEQEEKEKKTSRLSWRCRKNLRVEEEAAGCSA